MYDPLPMPAPECLPGEPTDAAPGSERKIRVLIERAARHEPLFHPQDGLRKAKDTRPFWVQRLAARWAQPGDATPPMENGAGPENVLDQAV